MRWVKMRSLQKSIQIIQSIKSEQNEINDDQSSNEMQVDDEESKSKFTNDA